MVSNQLGEAAGSGLVPALSSAASLGWSVRTSGPSPTTTHPPARVKRRQAGAPEALAVQSWVSADGTPPAKPRQCDSHWAARSGGKGRLRTHSAAAPFGPRASIWNPYFSRSSSSLARMTVALVGNEPARRCWSQAAPARASLVKASARSSAADGSVHIFLSLAALVLAYRAAVPANRHRSSKSVSVAGWAGADPRAHPNINPAIPSHVQSV